MKIGFYGATGSNDFGDWAMMVHNIKQILTINKDITIYLFTPDKYTTLKNLVNNLDFKTIDKNIIIKDEIAWSYSHLKLKGLKALCYFRIYNYYKRIFKNVVNENYRDIDRSFINTVKELDAFVFNGGGYIQYNWSYNNYLLLLTCIISKRNNVPVFFLGNSFGPMRNYKKYLELGLPYINSVIVRDGTKYSAQLLKDCGYNNYICGTDDLLFVNDYYDLKQVYHNYIIIEVMLYINKAQKGGQYILDELVQFVNHVTKTKNVLLINFDCDDGFASFAIQYIQKNSEMRERIYSCSKIKCMYEVFGYYKYADFSLSFKYHPLVLSIGSSVPCAGVICDNDSYYESKMKGVFDSCGLDWHGKLLTIDEFNSDSIIKVYENCIRNKSDYIISDRERLKSIYNSNLNSYLNNEQ